MENAGGGAKREGGKDEGRGEKMEERKEKAERWVRMASGSGSGRGGAPRRERANQPRGCYLSSSESAVMCIGERQVERRA